MCLSTRAVPSRRSNTAFEIVLDYNKFLMMTIEFCAHPTAPVASQLKKARAEVSEKNISKEQLEQLVTAKQKDVSNHVKHQAVEATAKACDIPVHELVKMRWVIKTKECPDGSNRVKAHVCMLGFSHILPSPPAVHSVKTVQYCTVLTGGYS